MRNDKVVGTALYIEIRRDGFTNQFILTPELVVSGKAVPMVLRTRVVSAANPRKPWSKRPSPKVSTIQEIEDGNKSLEDAVAGAVLRLEPYHDYFDNLKEGNWTLYNEPLAVQMTAVDAQDIADGGTPESLIRRIGAARIDAGYGESLWA
jgi:hypothetical protein